ncbi:hypothetical protein ASD01_17480 [Ensifer sp. Root423]|nr:hypothetical protein ASD01_17480 [Ensifer sp. Root423]
MSSSSIRRSTTAPIPAEPRRFKDRTRFLLETVEAAIGRIGSNRVAIRLSPYGQLFQMGLYPEIEETYLHIATELSKRDLACVHIMDQASRGSSPMPAGFRGDHYCADQ